MKELFQLLQGVNEVDATTLTVREQTRLQDNLPGLRWNAFFPRTNADSIRIAELRTLDLRPVADRRPWGGRGRYIPVETPNLALIEMLPIEAYTSYDEYSFQRLLQNNGQDIELMLRAAAVRIPERSQVLADANYRRVEIDAFEAWRTGTILAKDPESEQALTLSLGFDAGRYVTPTAWSTTTAYEEFLTHAFEAQNYFGSVAGAILRRSTLNAIQASAPVGTSGFRPTIADLQGRITDELGTQFTFRVEERTQQIFTGAGNQRVDTKVWNGTEVGFIPGGIQIGQTHFAPVVRAQMMARALPSNYVDVRGVTLFYIGSDDAKSLTLEAQLNALPLPVEDNIYVVNAGI